MIRECARSSAIRFASNGNFISQHYLDRISEIISLRKLLSVLNIDCVLDVGANLGQFAVELRSIGYKGVILSFEPVKTSFQELTDKMKGDDLWKGFPFALGSERKTAPISIPRISGMSSLLSPIGSVPLRRESVEIWRLDQVIDEIGSEHGVSRMFLKMDTQGYDLEVFNGASGCLNKIFGLQSELSVVPIYESMPNYMEALSTYVSSGFQLYNMSSVNRVADGGLLELNCLMKRA